MRDLKTILEGLFTRSVLKESLFDIDSDSNINILPSLYKRLIDKNPGRTRTKELLEDFIKNYPETKAVKKLSKKGSYAVFDTQIIGSKGWESLFLINIDSNEVMSYYDLSDLYDTAYGQFNDEFDRQMVQRSVIYKIPEKLYLEFQELFNEYN